MSYTSAFAELNAHYENRGGGGEGRGDWRSEAVSQIYARDAITRGLLKARAYVRRASRFPRSISARAPDFASAATSSPPSLSHSPSLSLSLSLSLVARIINNEPKCREIGRPVGFLPHIEPSLAIRTQNRGPTGAQQRSLRYDGPLRGLESTE